MVAVAAVDGEARAAAVEPRPRDMDFASALQVVRQVFVVAAVRHKGYYVDGLLVVGGGLMVENLDRVFSHQSLVGAVGRRRIQLSVGYGSFGQVGERFAGGHTGGFSRQGECEPSAVEEAYEDGSAAVLRNSVIRCGQYLVAHGVAECAEVVENLFSDDAATYG